MAKASRDAAKRESPRTKQTSRKVSGSKVKASRASGGKTAGGKTAGGKTAGGKTAGGKAASGKAASGKAEGGKVSRGTTRSLRAAEVQAETAKVNKSQAIRDFMAEHPQAGPNAVASALQQEGIHVTPGFVSTIKSMDKRRVGDELQEVMIADLESIPAATLLKAKKMAEQLGGVRNARAIFDALARIVD